MFSDFRSQSSTGQDEEHGTSCLNGAASDRLDLIICTRAMPGGSPVTQGYILAGPLLNEPMRVKTAGFRAPETWVVRPVGLQSERFRRRLVIICERLNCKLG